MASKQFVRLSANYFWYYAILGIVVPFLGVYLDFKGFSSLEIGEILAVITATKIVAPSLWAQFADRTGQQLGVVKLGALLSMLSFALILWQQTYWPLMFSLAMFSLFWTAILPQIEVMTLSSIRKSGKIYARIRLWGSIGFIVAAVVGGELIEQYSAEAFSWLGIIILAGLLASTLVSKQPRMSASQLDDGGSIKTQVLQSRFVLFFLAGLLLQVSFGPYYVFFVLYLNQLDYSNTLAGGLVALGVVAEVGIFITIGLFFRSFSVVNLLAISILMTGIRWLMIGHFAESMVILVLAQLMHAFGFGLYHSASIVFIQQHFLANQQSRAQAIYIGGVYGLGGAIGAYVAGLLWLEGSGAMASFNFAAIAAIVGGVLAMFIGAKKAVY